MRFLYFKNRSKMWVAAVLLLISTSASAIGFLLFVPFVSMLAAMGLIGAAVGPGAKLVEVPRGNNISEARLLPINPQPPTPPQPQAKDENCTTLGRFPSQLSNVGSKLLAVYPDPNELINQFYVQWNQEAMLINGDDLTQYMIRKLKSDFRIKEIESYFPNIGAKRDKSAWRIALAGPTTIREFSAAVDKAFLSDQVPYKSNDPEREYKKRTQCQYQVIDIIREPKKDVAAVNYNDHSFTARANVAADGDTLKYGYHVDWNQWFDDVSLPRDRPLQFQAIQGVDVQTISSDVLIMHKSYLENFANNPQQNNDFLKVKVALIDSGRAEDDIPGLVKFDHISDKSVPAIVTKTLGDIRSAHGLAVGMRLAAPSNDGLYNAGVISNEARKNIKLYYWNHGGDWRWRINTISGRIGSGYIREQDLFAYLGGAEFGGRPTGCAAFFSCFFSGTLFKISEVDVPHIISASYGAPYLLDKLKNLPKVELDKLSCEGVINKQRLDSRKYKIPIVKSAGNDPTQISSTVFGCGEHVIGVIGSDYMNNLLSPKSSRPSSEDMPGNYVAAPFTHYLPSYVGDSGFMRATIGTSYSAPTVAGIIATALTTVPSTASTAQKTPGAYYTAPVLYDLIRKSSKIPVYVEPEVSNSGDTFFEKPFVNGGCFFQWFAKNEAKRSLDKYNYNLIYTDPNSGVPVKYIADLRKFSPMIGVDLCN